MHTQTTARNDRPTCAPRPHTCSRKLLAGLATLAVLGLAAAPAAHAGEMGTGDSALTLNVGTDWQAIADLFSVLHKDTASARTDVTHPSAGFGSISGVFRAASIQTENAARSNRTLAPNISQTGGSAPDVYWNGNGSDNNWGTATNWKGTAPNSPQYRLHFAGTKNLNANNNFNSYSAGNQIFFDSGAGAFTLSGNAINFFDYGGVTPGFENNGSNLQTVTFQCNVENTSMNLVANTGDLTFSGTNFYLDNGAGLQASASTGRTITISDAIRDGNQTSGAVTFGGTDDTSNGGGAIILSGNNAYGGATTIDSGTVAQATGGTLGTGIVYVGNGGSGFANTNAALTMANSGLTTANTLVVNKADTGSAVGTGTRTIGGTFTSGISTFSGNVYLNGNVVLTSASGGTVDFSGVIQNGTDNGNTSHNVTKDGAGTIILMNASPNTYTGGTTVSQGTVSGNAASYGSGAVTVVQGATVDYTQSVTSGTAANDISGAGTASFGGQSNSPNGTGGTVNYTGSDSAAQTNVTSGTLALNNPSGAALSGPVSVATGATLQLNANNQIASTSNVTLNGGTLNANGHSDATVSPTTAAVTPGMGTLTLGSGPASTLDFGATQSGNGPLILAFADSSGKNTDGSLVLGSGSLKVTDYTGGVDELYIGTSADLSSSQLQQIAINGMGVTQLGNGEIVLSPSPEPGGLVTSLLGAGALGGMILLRRRRGAKAA